MHLTSIISGLLLALLLAAPANANWLSKIIGAAEHAGSRAVRHGAGSLDNVAAHIKALPHKPDGHALAAAATPEGHWRFVNRTGETITVASPEEMRRALSILVPDAAGAESRLALYLTEDAAFRHRALLKDLPKGADLHVLIDQKAYKLLRRPDATSERLFAEVRPNLVVELGERRRFDEAMFQLARPLNKANIRVIALEPGGPGALASAPRLDVTTGRVLTDAIDPDRLRHALGPIRGQTALVTGRVDGELLYFKPASGPERSLLLRDLTAAAEAADVNLVIVKSSAARQPGARNWLWQRVEVRGLDAALQRASLADFLDALGGSGGRMAVTATPQGALRTRLDIRPAHDLGPAPVTSPIADIFTDVVSELAGKVVTSGIDASLPSAERQRELDDRIIPGVPSLVQFAYIGSLVLGLFGLPVARGWWQRLWPAEQRQDYGSRFAYIAARTVRGVIMLLVFVPLVAVASVPVQAVLSLWNMVLTGWNLLVMFWRALTWPFRRLFGSVRA